MHKQNITRNSNHPRLSRKFEFPLLIFSFGTVPSNILTVILTFNKHMVLLLGYIVFANNYIKCLHFMFFVFHAKLLFSSSYQNLCQLLVNICKVIKLQDIPKKHQLCFGKNITTKWSYIWDCKESSLWNTLKVTKH
jgi:hypothetical protein